MATVSIHSGLIVFKRDIEFDPCEDWNKHRPKAQEKPKVPTNVDPRHWRRRYYLWSKFDCGILMDTEAWFEVTPENIASYIASRSSRKSFVHDCCCGVGGNSIQFALKGLKVAAVDLNSARLLMLRRNSSIYGVDDSIAVINRDVLDYLHDQPEVHHSGEAFFMSPPWGGEASYTKSLISVDDLPINLRTIIPLALTKYGALIIHLPQQFIMDDIFSILRNEGISYVEMDSIYYSKPVCHLKCHVIYADSAEFATSSLLIGPRRHQVQSLLPFLCQDRFSSVYADALLRFDYSGRYILRCLDIHRNQPECAVGIREIRRPNNGTPKSF